MSYGSRNEAHASHPVQGRRKCFSYIHPAILAGGGGSNDIIYTAQQHLCTVWLCINVSEPIISSAMTVKCQIMIDPGFISPKRKRLSGEKG